ncbi:MAG: hypothetical protein IPL86_19310 [Flavobacteriales bacterium]|nr:hypothetical protein [Flavobacteriales bacterium]
MRTTRANVISTRDNILAMADHLTPEVKRFMVLPVFNGRAKDIADGVTAFEPSGSAAYINILAVNDELSRTFGSNFLSDARDYMVRFAIHDAG